MKSILITATATMTAIVLNSCGTSDPEYQKWKKEKADQAAAATNPYGAPAAGANPYGTPQTAGDPGTTRAASGTTPYQPLPGVPQIPSGGVSSVPEIPPTLGAGSPGAAPVVGGVSHTVASGESLWGLARKYGTSIESIQAANGMTGTMIRTGQTLTIPGR